LNVGFEQLMEISSGIDVMDENVRESDQERECMGTINTVQGAFTEYFTAIIQDDIETLKSIFNSVDEETKLGLIKGTFSYNAEFHVKHDLKGKALMPMEVTTPLALSAAYASIQAFELLMQHGADVMQHESGDNNIVHILITTSHEDPTIEERAVAIYRLILCSVTQPSKRQLLLHCENADSKSPLELALKLRTYKLFKVILYTDGVFLEIVARKGKLLECKYDLSQYCISGKQNQSCLLHYLDFMTTSDLAALEESGVLQLPVMQSWMRNKMKLTLVPLLLWVLWRSLYPLLFFLVEIRSGDLAAEICRNETITNLPPESKWDKYVWTVLDAVITISTVGTDVIELGMMLFSNKSYFTSYKGMSSEAKSKYIVNNVVFKGCQLLFGLTTFTSFTVNTLIYIGRIRLQPTEQDVFVTVISVVLRPLLFFSLMYFLQFVSFMSIGTFVIGLQHMIKALVNFSFIFIAIIILFQTLFKNVVQHLCTSGPLLQHLCTSGPLRLCSYVEGIYKNYLIMLNMVHISDHVCNAAGNFLLQGIHVSFVFLISILMTNYLIAVMSSVFAILDQHQHTIQLLYQLQAANIIGNRLHWLSRFTRLDFFRLLRGSKEVAKITTLEVENNELFLLGSIRLQVIGFKFEQIELFKD
jgi:hypothetical protein